MNGWERMQLCSFLSQRKEKIVIDPRQEYSLVTISNRGNISLREKKMGALIGAVNGFIARSGDFIFSRLSVHTGAFGIVPLELEGALITNEMPCFQIDDTVIIPNFLLDALSQPDFLWQLKQLTKGVGRVRIKEASLLALHINVPSLEEQREIEARLNSLKNTNKEINAELTHQQTLLKKLRQQILQEAIEGKLTAGWRVQNPDVEPASELLERIAVEKAQLLKDKKIKAQKQPPPITDEEKSFDLPQGWEWCRLGDYASFERGKFSIRPRNDPSCFGGEYPFIQIGSLDEVGSVVNEFRQTLNAKGFAASKNFEKGTIAVAIVGGTIGNIGVLGSDMCFPDSMIGVRPSVIKNQDYILALLRYFQPTIKKAAYQMAGQPNIKLPTLNNLVCGLPSIEEQAEILVQVNRLLKYCDELETQTIQNQTHAEQLMQLVLREAFSHNSEAEPAAKKAKASADVLEVIRA